MRLFTRGNVQYLDLGVIDGKRVRLSTERLLKLMQVRGLLNARVKRPTQIEKAKDNYLQRCSRGHENRYGKPKSASQVRQDELTLSRLAARLAGFQIHDITGSDLRTYLAERGQACNPQKGTPIKMATLNREIAVLKSFFGYCLREQHCNENPAADLKQKAEHNLRTSWAATETELVRWREQLTGTPRDIFETLVGTSMRANEVLNLKPCDYDAVHHTLLIANPKEQRPAEVPVNSHVQGIIEARLNGEWVFASELGKPYTVDGIRSIFYRARDRARLRKFTLHDLRRSSATAMLNAGVDIRRIQAVLRHRSLDTTMRYLGVRPEGLQEAVEAISGLGVAQGRHSSEAVPVSAEVAEVGKGSADYESAALTS
jgi:site-specific recombinase XerD